MYNNPMKRKKSARIAIDCVGCRDQSGCCNFGAWIDLEEAKKILSLGIKGDFFHLEIDKEFPSGYKVGTSIEDEKCVFLDPDGLCRVHKFDYTVKPAACKEFPYEGGKIAPLAGVLCSVQKARIKKSRARRSK